MKVDRQSLESELRRLIELRRAEFDEPLEAACGLSVPGAWAPYILKPNCEVEIEDLDGSKSVHADEKSIITALVYLSSSYPSLLQFLPARESSSIVCSACGGTGKFTIGSQSFNPALCHECSGLGWREGET